MNNLAKYDVVLVDAANTIIHKPSLWTKFGDTLRAYGYDVDDAELRRKHKVISEIIHFPDQTSKEFYQKFNGEVLFALGIVPDDALLDAIFSSCTYLPWEVFEDVRFLGEINQKKAILSNFNGSLRAKVKDLTGSLFEKIIVSEEEGVAKPNAKFYQVALDKLGVEAHKVLYIGDSLKLDIVPASTLGIEAWLIDRDDNFPYFSKRIQSFEDLKQI